MKYVIRFFFVLFVSMIGANTAMAQKPVVKKAAKTVKATGQKKAVAGTTGKTIDKLLNDYEGLLESIKDAKKEGIPGGSSFAMRIADKDEQLTGKLDKLKKQMTPEQKKRYDELVEKVGKEAETWE